MSNQLATIDPAALDTVTGGKSNSKSGTNIDSLISQLNSMTGTIKDIQNKTKGFGQTEMFMLWMLALRNQQPQANVVYVGRPRWF